MLICFLEVFQIFFFWVLPPPPLKWRLVAYLSKKWDIFCSRLICHLWGQQRFISCLLDASVACRVVSHLLKIGPWACELGENTDHCEGSRVDVTVSLGRAGHLLQRMRAGHLLQRMLHLGKECRPCSAVNCAHVKGTGLIAMGWSPLYPQEIGSKG